MAETNETAIQEATEYSETLRREFTTNVSHELKTPLTTIYGIADMLAGGMVEEKDVVHFSKKIRDETSRMIALIEDIMRLSQMDENSLSQEKESVDLLPLIQNTIAQLYESAKQKNITIEIQGASIRLFGVPLILEEMVYNLCDNAIKYNVESGKIIISLSREENYALLSVEDTGIGISESEQQRVFERFYRVDKSHSRAMGGTGLGLSIVKHGAAYHNAKISLSSKLREGTKIIVKFPMEQEPAKN